MLAQNLIQNPIICNQDKINWTSAVPLVNLNFWFEERGVEETEHFRHNQYPYTPYLLTTITTPTTKEELKITLQSLPLHAYIILESLEADHAQWLSELIGGQTITAGAYLIRVHTSNELDKDYLVLRYAVGRYLYSPSGWYIEYNDFIPNTLRPRLWGLKQKYIYNYPANTNDYSIDYNNQYLTLSIPPQNELYYFAAWHALSGASIDTPLAFAVDNWERRVPMNNNMLTDGVEVLLGIQNGNEVDEIRVYAQLQRRFTTRATAAQSYYTYDIIIPNRGYESHLSYIKLM